MNEEQAGRLRAALEYVTEHPREWVQDYYAVRTPCGTLACLAGRIVLQAGYELSNWVQVDYFDSSSSTYLSIPGTQKSAAVALADDVGDASLSLFRAMISTVAANLVGLDYIAAFPLFASSNSLRDLWERAAELSDGLIEVPGELPEWADLGIYDVDRSESHWVGSHVAAYLDDVERRLL